MIIDSAIDECLNRLQAHFGKRVVVRPPASTAELAQLEEAAGHLPRDLTMFLVTCNGLRVDVAALPEDRHLWHTHEMLCALGGGRDTACRRGLLPVRGALEAECDFVVTGAGPMHGCVIRREAFVPGATLLASTFARFVDGWSRYLVEAFDESGQALETPCPPFHPTYITAIDESLTHTASEPEIISWLARLTVADGSGTDFE